MAPQIPSNSPAPTPDSYIWVDRPTSSSVGSDSSRRNSTTLDGSAGVSPLTLTDSASTHGLDSSLYPQNSSVGFATNYFRPGPGYLSQNQLPQPADVGVKAGTSVNRSTAPAGSPTPSRFRSPSIESVESVETVDSAELFGILTTLPSLVATDSAAAKSSVALERPLYVPPSTKFFKNFSIPGLPTPSSGAGVTWGAGPPTPPPADNTDAVMYTGKPVHIAGEIEDTNGRLRFHIRLEPDDATGGEPQFFEIGVTGARCAELKANPEKLTEALGLAFELINKSPHARDFDTVTLHGPTQDGQKARAVVRKGDEEFTLGGNSNDYIPGTRCFFATEIANLLQSINAEVDPTGQDNSDLQPTELHIQRLSSAPSLLSDESEDPVAAYVKKVRFGWKTPQARVENGLPELRALARGLQRPIEVYSPEIARGHFSLCASLVNEVSHVNDEPGTPPPIYLIFDAEAQQYTCVKKNPDRYPLQLGEDGRLDLTHLSPVPGKSADEGNLFAAVAAAIPGNSQYTAENLYQIACDQMLADPNYYKTLVRNTI